MINQVQQFQHPNVNGTEEARPPQGGVQKKRFWGPRTKKNVATDNLPLAEAAKIVSYK